MSRVYRVFVEKRKDYAVEAAEIFNNLKTQLKLEKLENVKVINRYDIQGIGESAFIEGIPTILSEPMVDDVFQESYDSKGGKNLLLNIYLVNMIKELMRVNSVFNY